MVTTDQLLFCMSAKMLMNITMFKLTQLYSSLIIVVLSLTTASHCQSNSANSQWWNLRRWHMSY